MNLVAGLSLALGGCHSADAPSRCARLQRLCTSFKLVLARYLNGTFWPPGLAGPWFYSAAAALLMGEFLLEPFLRGLPMQSERIAVPLSATTVSLADAQISQHNARVGRDVFIATAIGVLILAMIAVSMKDWSVGAERSSHRSRSVRSS